MLDASIGSNLTSLNASRELQLLLERKRLPAWGISSYEFHKKSGKIIFQACSSLYMCLDTGFNVSWAENSYSNYKISWILPEYTSIPHRATNMSKSRLGTNRPQNLPTKFWSRRIRFWQWHLRDTLDKRTWRETDTRAQLETKWSFERWCAVVCDAGGVQSLSRILVATEQLRRRLPHLLRGSWRKRCQRVFVSLGTFVRRRVLQISSSGNAKRPQHPQNRRVPFVGVTTHHRHVQQRAPGAAELSFPLLRVHRTHRMDARLKIRSRAASQSTTTTSRPNLDSRGKFLLRAVQQQPVVARKYLWKAHVEVDGGQVIEADPSDIHGAFAAVDQRARSASLSWNHRNQRRVSLGVRRIRLSAFVPHNFLARSKAIAKRTSNAFSILWWSSNGRQPESADHEENAADDGRVGGVGKESLAWPRTESRVLYGTRSFTARKTSLCVQPTRFRQKTAANNTGINKHHRI